MNRHSGTGQRHGRRPCGLGRQAWTVYACRAHGSLCSQPAAASCPPPGSRPLPIWSRLRLLPRLTPSPSHPPAPPIPGSPRTRCCMRAVWPPHTTRTGPTAAWPPAHTHTQTRQEDRWWPQPVWVRGGPGMTSARAAMGRATQSMYMREPRPCVRCACVCAPPLSLGLGHVTFPLPYPP